MQLDFNYNQPLIMHIDLNSCFAIIEQQANPLLRHKPVAIAAYDSPGGAVIASSYEAKARGIKLGVNVREARLLAPDVCIRMPDPAKYRDAHKRFKAVLTAYTGNVTPKSIDEFVIEFTGSPALRSGKTMQDIGYEIKQRIKDSLGNYVTVNVGIGTNRFLAKTAAGLNKPDGLDTITAHNLTHVYSSLQLTDLTGINVRFAARLNAAGIYTPLDFLNAPADLLAKKVFKSRVGYDWYARLRGWEVDNIAWGTKTFGHQYALGKKTKDKQELSKILAKLCEKTGRRMRRNNYSAHGVHLWVLFANRTHWAKGRHTHNQLYASQDIYIYAQRLLNEIAIPANVTNIGVSVYKLTPSQPRQQSLFAETRLDSYALADATDDINNRYGEFTIVPGIMTGMEGLILDRIAFGSVKDM
jgi:DNA polymerase IV